MLLHLLFACSPAPTGPSSAPTPAPSQAPAPAPPPAPAGPVAFDPVVSCDRIDSASICSEYPTGDEAYVKRGCEPAGGTTVKGPCPRDGALGWCDTKYDRTVFYTRGATPFAAGGAIGCPGGAPLNRF